MWALGVVAFELLTNQRAFPTGTSAQSIRDALGGLTPLPWEDGADGVEQSREKLRGLRRVVLACLSRNPAGRPAAKNVLHLLYNMFDEMKSRGTFATVVVPQESQHELLVHEATAQRYRDREERTW